MATLQTNPLHDTEDDEPITDLQAGCTILGSRPASLAVTAATADTEDVAPSWTGGLGHGCAPVFQPFGSPSRSRGNIMSPQAFLIPYCPQPAIIIIIITVRLSD